VGCADIKICLYDVVSLETHSNNENMFIGDGRIDLPPEHLKPFRSARVSDPFQFMKAGVGAHDSINPSRVRREDGLREVQEVPEELRLCGIDFQNSFDCRTQLNLARCRNG